MCLTSSQNEHSSSRACRGGHDMYQCIIWQPCDSLEIKQSAGFSLLYVVAVVVALQKCSRHTSVGAKIKFLRSNISLHRSQLSVHYMTDMWHFYDIFTWTWGKWRDDDCAVKRPLSCVRFLSLSIGHVYKTWPANPFKMANFISNWKTSKVSKHWGLPNPGCKKQQDSVNMTHSDTWWHMF